MQRSTFKVLFYLKKNSLKPDGTAPIMGRITVNGSIAQFSCKLNIKPSLWDTTANRAAGKSLQAQKINQKLDNIWEKKFWLTEFSHLGSNGNPTKSNLVLVTKAARDKTFNLDELKPINKKLKDILK